jgi:hypothetical protein
LRVFLLTLTSFPIAFSPRLFPTLIGLLGRKKVKYGTYQKRNSGSEKTLPSRVVGNHLSLMWRRGSNTASFQFHAGAGGKNDIHQLDI